MRKNFSEIIAIWTRALKKIRQPCPWPKKSLKNVGFKDGQITNLLGASRSLGPTLIPIHTVSYPTILERSE
jgi:hypothetical protein